MSAQPVVVVKAGCPFSFRLLVFLTEAGLRDTVEVRVAHPGTDEGEALAQTLRAATGQAPSYPTVLWADGTAQSDSQALVERFAAEAGVDTAGLPLLSYWNAVMLPAFSANFRGLKAAEARVAELERKAADRVPAFVPEGYSTVSPYLMVTDAAATIRFLEQALGGALVRTHPDEEGRLRHAEVRIGDTLVMLADTAPGWPAIESHVHVYVDDVDAAYARALAAGATSVQAPVKKDDEDKRGGVKDAGGTTWWIATRVG
jgi:uncharacterized glyoxalase superfamily protein PhnB